MAPIAESETLRLIGQRNFGQARGGNNEGGGEHAGTLFVCTLGRRARPR